MKKNDIVFYYYAFSYDTMDISNMWAGLPVATCYQPIMIDIILQR